ncbi:uncharacterized protein GGS22DRAFT_145727 [Annulohypoxylon maeteangense]|uniref:uncharacterized protein n=1 Tax=Annulohypoxylon maeteangense TaxID=1927788 RepID=UPI002008B7FD|nr:uncharacterized protein GGS22DRAFT_145727 [Annulohypoxylon maeteangense]KAI0884684.1 hypothetical protein GGS22DRAFT_145727 [Annulohypoxylon maeteangense]
MQFTMGRPTDARHQSVSTRQSVVKPDPYKQNIIKQHRHKSQPFDPDDLRRRLYVVIAEQEAAKEKRKRRERLAEVGTVSTQSKDHDTPISRPESTKPGPNESSFAARVTRRKSMLSDPPPPPKESSIQPPEPKTGRSMSKSIQDKLRRKSVIKSEPPPASKTTDKASQTQAQTQPQPPTYHHVPQSAAAQFERTTTVNGMRDRNLSHSLSQSGLKHHAKDRASPDPTQQQSQIALERANSNSSKPHFQNPFQNNARPISASSHADHEDIAPHFRRHSIIGLTQVKMRRRSSAIGNIAEDESTTQTFTVGLHPVLGVPIEVPIDEISSEETLAVPGNPADHRVDWTQSDEVDVKPRSRIPLLRKADSLWALKGRLGGRSGSLSLGGGKGEKFAAGGGEKNREEGLGTRFWRLGFLTRFKR